MCDDNTNNNTTLNTNDNRNFLVGPESANSGIFLFLATSATWLGHGGHGMQELVHF